MKNLVIIGMVIPEPKSTAAGKRMLQLIDFFKLQSYKITFLSAANNWEYSQNLDEIGVCYQKIEINDDSFSMILQQLQPDIVLFDRFVTEEQFGWKVAETCPGAIRILDTEDLHFLRKAREWAYKNNVELNDNLLQNEVFCREIASVVRCDMSLIISKFEYDLLVDKFKINKEILLYFPLFAEVLLGKNSFEERENFISIGNFLHEPNWQTVLNLKKIWPEIKKQIPKAKMLIYGAYVTEKAKQLHNEKQGFLVMGRANSVEEIYNEARVLLAPIPFGAGIKGKLLDAMQYGLPSVTSTTGAEGMQYNNEWNGFVADDSQDFIDRAIELYTQSEIWKKAQKKGVEIVQENFDKDKFYPILSIQIQTIFQNLEQHRNQNFWGKILLHHTLQSTKYLGKWIEEKNKNRG